MSLVLTIDPSGSGSTGVCLINKKEGGESFTFFEFKDSNWEEHLLFLFCFLNIHKPDIVVFETTNYIKHKMQSSLDLLKLIGAIVSLKLFFEFINSLDSVAVNQVKACKRKIQEKKVIIPNLNYELGRGKGWSYQGKRISLHQLDAFIVFFLWQKKKKS